MIKKIPYLYMAKTNKTLHTSLTGHQYQSDFLTIEENGDFTIHASTENPFLFDGNSPKFRFSSNGKAYGTPDGPIDEITGLPQTYWQSALHDLLYQHLGRHSLDRRQCDQVYRETLKQVGFKWPNLFYYGLRACGGVYHSLFVKRKPKFIVHGGVVL